MSNVNELLVGSKYGSRRLVLLDSYKTRSKINNISINLRIYFEERHYITKAKAPIKLSLLIMRTFIFVKLRSLPVVYRESYVYLFFVISFLSLSFDCLV